MKIVQMLPTISFGDAISNDAIALASVIENLNYTTGIYAENIDKRLQSGLICPIKNISHLKKDDVLIYHLSVGTKLNYRIAELKCKKIIVYHNITPSVYFVNYNKNVEKLSIEGLNETEFLANHVDYCLADSEFNKRDLLNMNYSCAIDVLPILIAFSDYNQEPDLEIINKFKDEWTNFLFVGRIAPHKKQEDIIKTFYYYKKYVNSKSRLFMVGNYSGMEQYYNELKKYVQILRVKDVYFTGHIKFNQILAYYKVADVFLSMSEHEGFCVPLVEAMYFDVPIFAYDSSAVAETLGGSGILLKEKNFLETAFVIEKVIKNNKLKNCMLNAQKENLKRFEHSHIENLFVKYLKSFISKSC